jgi:signal transduction histidine kinase
MNDLIPESVLQQRIPLGEMVDLPSFQEVCRSFADLYRIGVKVFDAHGKRLVDIKVASDDFCGYVFTFQPGRERCTTTVGRVKDQELQMKGVERIQCFTGARYLVLPIVYEMDFLGRAVLGPFIPDDLKGLPATLLDMGPGFEAAHAKDLMDRIRRAPETTVQKILEHFGTILQVLVFTSYRVFLTSRVHLEAVKESYRVAEAKGKELQASFDKLKELDTLKSNFLATVSHELRTPLTSIIGYTDMLLEGLAGDVSTEQREYLSTVMDKSESLLQMITGMLELTRVEADRIHVHRTTSDPTTVVHDAVTTVIPMAKRKKIEINQKLSPDLPKISMDAGKVQQSLLNLLANAVKFTREGGHIEVEALITQSGNGRFGGDEWLELRVSDDGIGIAPDQIDRVFDTFYQVDGSSTREFGGVGLGLALVKSYIEAHGGEVTVESALGQGSRFSLRLPLQN